MLSRLAIHSPSWMAQDAQETRKALDWAAARLTMKGQSASLELRLRDIIWECLEDAADTLSRLPDRERGWLTSADRSCWPEVHHTAQEHYEAELQRLTDLKEERQQTPLRRLAITDPSAIPRMLTVLGWLQHVRARNFLREKRDKLIVLAMAQGQPRNVIRRLMLGDRSDSAARMVKQKVLGQIEGVLSVNNRPGVHNRC